MLQTHNGQDVASGELNKVFILIFSNTDHTHIIHDDLIIATPTVEAHNRALEIVLNRIMEVGLTLNYEKYFFKLKKNPILGSANQFLPRGHPFKFAFQLQSQVEPHQKLNSVTLSLTWKG